MRDIQNEAFEFDSCPPETMKSEKHWHESFIMHRRGAQLLENNPTLCRIQKGTFFLFLERHWIAVWVQLEHWTCRKMSLFWCAFFQIGSPPPPPLS